MIRLSCNISFFRSFCSLNAVSEMLLILFPDKFNQFNAFRHLKSSLMHLSSLFIKFKVFNFGSLLKLLEVFLRELLFNARFSKYIMHWKDADGISISWLKDRSKKVNSLSFRKEKVVIVFIKFLLKFKTFSCFKLIKARDVMEVIKLSLRFRSTKPSNPINVESVISLILLRLSVRFWSKLEFKNALSSMVLMVMLVKKRNWRFFWFSKKGAVMYSKVLFERSIQVNFLKFLKTFSGKLLIWLEFKFNFSSSNISSKWSSFKNGILFSFKVKEVRVDNPWKTGREMLLMYISSNFNLLRLFSCVNGKCIGASFFLIGRRRYLILLSVKLKYNKFFKSLNESTSSLNIWLDDRSNLRRLLRFWRSLLMYFISLWLKSKTFRLISSDMEMLTILLKLKSTSCSCDAFSNTFSGKLSRFRVTSLVFEALNQRRLGKSLKTSLGINVSSDCTNLKLCTFTFFWRFFFKSSFCWILVFWTVQVYVTDNETNSSWYLIIDSSFSQGSSKHEAAAKYTSKKSDDNIFNLNEIKLIRSNWLRVSEEKFTSSTFRDHFWFTQLQSQI